MKEKTEKIKKKSREQSRDLGIYKDFEVFTKL